MLYNNNDSFRSDSLLQEEINKSGFLASGTEYPQLFSGYIRKIEAEEVNRSTSIIFILTRVGNFLTAQPNDLRSGTGTGIVGYVSTESILNLS